MRKLANTERFYEKCQEIQSDAELAAVSSNTCFGNRRCIQGAKFDRNEDPDDFVGFEENCQCDNDESILNC